MDELRWYAVRTRSNHERKVSALLAEKRVEHYLPSFSEAHQWKDRRKMIERPLFPGYLFAQMVDSRESRLCVLRSEGVVSILGHGDTPEAVPDQEIEAVRQLLNSRSRCQAHPLLQEGAWVRLKRGPLKNLEGLLTRIKNQTHLVLSITLLSQSVSTEIDVSDVQFLRSANPQVRRVA